MDVPTLILLGAAGGLLRGALDLYTRFVSWQADRRAHRLMTAPGAEQRNAPQFQAYFDPSVDIVAAIVHCVMGVGAAVLFGTTGQINGEYAALVVGMSAPMLLTQLGRIQTVNEAVTGDRQPAGETAEAPSATGAIGAGGGDGSGAVEAQSAAADVAPPAPSAPLADPLQPAAPAEGALPPAQRMPSSGPQDAVADARTPEPTPGERSEEPTPLSRPARSREIPSSAEPANGTGPDFEGRGAPRWQQRPPIGDERL